MMISDSEFLEAIMRFLAFVLNQTLNIIADIIRNIMILYVGFLLVINTSLRIN